MIKEQRKQRRKELEKGLWKGVSSQGLVSQEKRQGRHKRAVANRINKKGRMVRWQARPAAAFPLRVKSFKKFTLKRSTKSGRKRAAKLKTVGKVEPLVKVKRVEDWKRRYPIRLEGKARFVNREQHRKTRLLSVLLPVLEEDEENV